MVREFEQRLMEITRRFAGGDVGGAMARMAELERECSTDAERADVMARYATFFHLLDLREEGLAAIARALALDPCNPRARYLNALQLMIDERWEDAVTELNKAARYYPPDDTEHLAEVYGNLAYCWDQLGDVARAGMYDEICADLDPEGVLVEAPRGEWLDSFEASAEGDSGPGPAGAVEDARPAPGGDEALSGSEWIAEMVLHLAPRGRRRACRGRRRSGGGRNERGGEARDPGVAQEGAESRRASSRASRRRSGARSSRPHKVRRGRPGGRRS